MADRAYDVKTRNFYGAQGDGSLHVVPGARGADIIAEAIDLAKQLGHDMLIRYPWPCGSSPWASDEFAVRVTPSSTPQQVRAAIEKADKAWQAKYSRAK